MSQTGPARSRIRAYLLTAVVASGSAPGFAEGNPPSARGKELASTPCPCGLREGPFRTNWMDDRSRNPTIFIGGPQRYAQADAAAPAAAPPRDPTKEPSATPDSRTLWRIVGGEFVGFGRFEPQGGQPAATDGGRPWWIGAMLHDQSGLRLGFEFFSYSGRYETPQNLRARSYESEMKLDVHSLVGKAGYFARRGFAEVYADAGLGFYSTAMSVSRPLSFLELLALCFSCGEVEAKSNDFGADFRAGVALNLGKLRLGYEMRRLALRGSYGELSNNGSMPIGGRFSLVTIGLTFPETQRGARYSDMQRASGEDHPPHYDQSERQAYYLQRQPTATLPEARAARAARGR
jgi:hypothetical protein